MARFVALSLAMGMTLVCLPALAQRPGGFGRGPGGGTQGPAMLLGSEAVQKDLGLTEDQIAKVRELGQQAREMLQAGAGDFQGLRDLPEAEREAKMTELREKMAETAKKVNDELKPKIAAILSAEQVERLQQISWQAAGPAALGDETLAKALSLTAEQTEKLKTIAAETRTKMQALGGGRGPGGGGDQAGFEERMTKMREINESAQTAAMEVLTAEQKDQLTKLKGKEFDVSQLRRGPGGPGGAPGGARPARPE